MSGRIALRRDSGCMAYDNFSWSSEAAKDFTFGVVISFARSFCVESVLYVPVRSPSAWRYGQE